MKIGLAKLLDWNTFAEIMTHIVRYTGDFKNFDRRRAPRGASLKGSGSIRVAT